MKFPALAFIIAVTASVNFSQDVSQRLAQSQQASVEAEVKVELNATASSYKAGDFVGAQQHVERAVLLDPSNKTAAIFLARVRHTRYRPGDEAPQNLELARAAVDAYQRVLTLDSENEEAYRAIAVLYASTHQEELLRAWVMQRALNSQVATEKRAEAYAILAGKDWDCSFKFTELPNHKLVDVKRNKATVVYKLPPEDIVEFQRVKQCVAEGFEMADAAILLENENEAAWSYKTNLFLEAAKLAEMEGSNPAKTDYERQSREASQQLFRISEKRRGDASGNTIEILPREIPPPKKP